MSSVSYRIRKAKAIHWSQQWAPTPRTNSRMCCDRDGCTISFPRNGCCAADVGLWIRMWVVLPTLQYVYHLHNMCMKWTGGRGSPVREWCGHKTKHCPVQNASCSRLLEIVMLYMYASSTWRFGVPAAPISCCNGLTGCSATVCAACHDIQPAIPPETAVLSDWQQEYGVQLSWGNAVCFNPTFLDPLVRNPSFAFPQPVIRHLSCWKR